MDSALPRKHSGTKRPHQSGKQQEPEEQDLFAARLDEIPANELEAVLTLLINLKRLQYGISDSPENVLDAFETALARSGFPEWAGDKAAAWEDRKPLLKALLATPDNALGIMAKVRVLLFESQCVLHDSMVLTDVRHIYNV